MSYYPKSQIKTNLSANGPDAKLTTQPLQQQLYDIVNFYTGPYYETSSGNKYTGKFPGDGNNLLLFPVTDYAIEDTQLFPEDFSNQIIVDPLYSGDPQPSIPIPRSLPNFTPGKPTPQETQEGVFRRYFCKKNNEIKYLEIDKATYDKLSQRDPQIAWDLYSPTSISWLFKGNKELIYTSNKSQTELVERRLKWYGFSQYFQGKFLKYYLES